jgi:hypothetical protein
MRLLLQASHAPPPTPISTTGNGESMPNAGIEAHDVLLAEAVTLFGVPVASSRYHVSVPVKVTVKTLVNVPGLNLVG